MRPQTYAALTLIETAPGTEQQTISDALDIQRPSRVILIDGLIARGWVDRRVNPTDRRSYALHLTTSGTALLKSTRKADDDDVAREQRLLSDEERLTLEAARESYADRK